MIQPAHNPLSDSAFARNLEKELTRTSLSDSEVARVLDSEETRLLQEPQPASDPSKPVTLRAFSLLKSLSILSFAFSLVFFLAFLRMARSLWCGLWRGRNRKKNRFHCTHRPPIQNYSPSTIPVKSISKFFNASLLSFSLHRYFFAWFS